MQVTSVKKGRAEEKQKPNEDTHGRGGCGVFSGCERWWGGGETSIFRGTLPYAIVCLKTQRVRAKQNKLKF